MRKYGSTEVFSKVPSFVSSKYESKFIIEVHVRKYGQKYFESTEVLRKYGSSFEGTEVGRATVIHT